MAIEASFTATDDDFPLAKVFSKYPEAQIELDRVVPTNNVLIPYFWLQNEGESKIDVTGIEHPGINDLQIIDEVNGDAFIRINWDFEYESLITGILETDVELISAIGKKDRWTFNLRVRIQR